MIRLFLTKRFFVPVFISLFCYYWLAYQLNREDFTDLISCFALSFGAYYLLIKRKHEKSLSFFIGIGTLFRLLFLVSIPALSDDYFRFIWDGQLSAIGINPFSSLPHEVGVEFRNKELLLEGMNSQEYYTVYPPVSQLIYWLSSIFSSDRILSNIIAIRAMIIVAELGTVYLMINLLKKFKMNPRFSLLYFLNPLVVVELSGNLHFEGIMIFFFILAIHLLVSKKNYLVAALPWALAAATKLIPIFFLPVLLRRFPTIKAIIFYLIFIVIFLAAWIPFIREDLIHNFMESITLYSRTFEFNASIYYICRWIGYQIKDYNAIATIGPWLTRLAYLGMMIILLRRKIGNWQTVFPIILLSLTCYYFLALIIHPWYICSLVALSVFSRFRYAIVWSGLIILSYWAYSNSDYYENYWLIAVEYTIVFTYLFYELIISKKPIYSTFEKEIQVESNEKGA